MATRWAQASPTSLQRHYEFVPGTNMYTLDPTFVDPSFAASTTERHDLACVVFTDFMGRVDGTVKE